LHRIPNLSRRFLYFNNDCFVGRAVSLAVFWVRILFYKSFRTFCFFNSSIISSSYAC
jgi:hypothetical protein